MSFTGQHIVSLSLKSFNFSRIKWSTWMPLFETFFDCYIVYIKALKKAKLFDYKILSTLINTKVLEIALIVFKKSTWKRKKRN